MCNHDILLSEFPWNMLVGILKIILGIYFYDEQEFEIPQFLIISGILEFVFGILVLLVHWKNHERLMVTTGFIGIVECGLVLWATVLVMCKYQECNFDGSDAQEDECSVLPFLIAFITTVIDWLKILVLLACFIFYRIMIKFWNLSSSAFRN